MANVRKSSKETVVMNHLSDKMANSALQDMNSPMVAPGNVAVAANTKVRLTTLIKRLIRATTGKNGGGSRRGCAPPPTMTQMGFILLFPLIYRISGILKVII